MSIIQVEKGWRVDVMPGGRNGKRIRKTFVRHADALKFDTKLKAEYQQGAYLGQHSTITFGKACENYWRFYAIPNGQTRDFSKIAFFKRELGEEIPCNKIDEHVLKSLFARMTTIYAPSSILRNWVLLQSIFRENKKHIPVNPAKGIVSKKIRMGASRSNTGRRRFFSNEEMQTIYRTLLSKKPFQVPEHARENFYYAQIARNVGGLRPGSIEKLEWADISFEKKTVFARGTKNGRSYTFPLNNAAIQAFKELWIMKGKPSNGKIFRPACFTKIFMAVFRELGWNDTHLPKEERKISDRDQAVLYSFRHTFCSHLVMAGVTGKPLWDLMGWENGTEEATYSHLAPGHKEKLVNAISLVPKIHMENRV